MGNQASVGLKTFEDLVKGTLVDLPKGLVSTISGSPNWHAFTNDWSNFGSIVKGIGNPNTPAIQNILNPPSQAMKDAKEAESAQTERNDSAFNDWTATNHVVNSAYSGQMGNISRPSHIARIMDPTYKFAIASSSGKGKRQVLAMSQMMDQAVAHDLWQTSAGSGGSKTIKASGGTGAPIQEDAVSRPSLYPNVNVNQINSHLGVKKPDPVLNSYSKNV